MTFTSKVVWSITITCIWININCKAVAVRMQLYRLNTAVTQFILLAVHDGWKLWCQWNLAFHLDHLVKRVKKEVLSPLGWHMAMASLFRGKDSVLCFYCSQATEKKLLPKDNSKTDPAFMSVGFTNWKDACSRFRFAANLS